MSYEKVEIIKDGNLKKLHYETSNVQMNKNLTSEEYNKLFEKLEPTIGFSLPDKLIQDFVKDGSMIPSFKKSDTFTNDDLFNIIKIFKKDFKEIKKKKKQKKNKKKYFKSKTKKKSNKNKKIKKKINKKKKNVKTKKNKKQKL